MHSHDFRKECTEIVIDESEQSCDNASGNSKRDSSPDVDDEIIYVPNNPKEWTEKHIETWVNWVSKQFDLKPSLDPTRFPKDAEEMAKFTKAEFYIVCGSFEGGKTISQHYKYMMQNAKENFDETLLTDGDPGEFWAVKSVLKCQGQREENKMGSEVYLLLYPLNKPEDCLCDDNPNIYQCLI